MVQARKKELGCELDNVLVTETGESYWKKTEGGNRSQLVPNIWKGLCERVQKDFPKFRFLPFNSLRDTSSNMIREIAGGETASLHLAHRHSSEDKHLSAYTNPRRKRHARAIRTLGKKLAPVFAVAGAEPFAERSKNYVGLEKIKQIQK